MRLELASLASGDPSPNTVTTSTGMLSNSMFAIENAPTSQPARDHATHGAGAFLPFSLIICSWPSPDLSVQHRNELWDPTEPPGRKKP